MNFKEALKKLNIEDYGDRIMKSNSCGELFHIWDYFEYAKQEDTSWFRELFESAVEMAEKNWTRPESVFQHIPQIFCDWADYIETQ